MRCVAFLGALFVAAALHVLIAAGFDAAPPAIERRAEGRGAALNVRALPAPLRPAEAEDMLPPMPVAAAPALAARSPAQRRPSAVAAAIGPSAAAARPDPAAHAVADAVSEASPVPPARTGSTLAAAPSLAGVEPLPRNAAPAQDVPLYATRIPPSATLNYRLRRGTLRGEAELRWQHVGERYQAQLHASVAGAPLFRQSSEGGLDAAGLAPERFTDQRARRGTRAISFQREASRVSFSSVPGALDLAAGMQDRLSWIAQLAAVASANPDRLVAGGEIVLMLVGTRGEAVLWRFVSLGSGAGEETNALPTIHLQRLPVSTYDTAIDVWLDPVPPHWPVRAQWRNGPADAGLELWRVDTDPTR